MANVPLDANALFHTVMATKCRLSGGDNASPQVIPDVDAIMIGRSGRPMEADPDVELRAAVESRFASLVSLKDINITANAQ